MSLAVKKKKVGLATTTYLGLYVYKNIFMCVVNLFWSATVVATCNPCNDLIVSSPCL